MAEARRVGPDGVVAEIRASGLRGRGGAGFPTALKWSGILQEAPSRCYVVCNAAEGEPGTFKDRALIRANPYQLLEGIAVAAETIGAVEAYVGIKARFHPEIERLEMAATEMSSAGLLGDVPVRIVEGPDDYLFGEEKGLLEVIEGNDPLPRLVPPYIEGLFADRDSAGPAVVNNVETLSNIPRIMRDGADAFRNEGTHQSPGTMVFTISGAVRREAVAEAPLGAPLSFLVYGPGAGLEAGRRPKAVISGASNAPLGAGQLDTPLSYEGMAAAGSGLGAGGLIVYDDTDCMVRVGAVLSTFLARSSCGQCPPCKLGTTAIAERLWRLEHGGGSIEAVEEIAAWVGQVTDANRCGLGLGERVLTAGLLERFWDEVEAHLTGECPLPGETILPMIDDWDQEAGRFVYRS
jgi:NADH:ubiquinone oxidoreductase subunit F (NADH-binding)